MNKNLIDSIVAWIRERVDVKVLYQVKRSGKQEVSVDVHYVDGQGITTLGQAGMAHIPWRNIIPLKLSTLGGETMYCAPHLTVDCIKI